jgi:hypothetical protein
MFFFQKCFPKQRLVSETFQTKVKRIKIGFQVNQALKILG